MIDDDVHCLMIGDGPILTLILDSDAAFDQMVQFISVNQVKSKNPAESSEIEGKSSSIWQRIAEVASQFFLFIAVL